MSLHFKRVTESDAELLLKWRTDPEITRHMFTDLMDPNIEQQKAWINSLATREDYIAYVVYDDEQAVGFICFSDINKLHQRCSTGTYIYERPARIKYAATLNTYVCSYAFYRLQCNKIIDEVLGANESIIKLQKLYKARLVGYLRQHIFKSGHFHDVYIFEHLKEDWEKEHHPFGVEHVKKTFDDWLE